jgi:hypothetical protein
MLGVHAVIENAVDKMLAIKRRPGIGCGGEGEDENAEERDTFFFPTKKLSFQTSIPHGAGNWKGPFGVQSTQRALKRVILARISYSTTIPHRQNQFPQLVCRKICFSLTCM